MNNNKPKVTSAGLLVYKIEPAGTARFYLAHPGGPFYARKDAGSWTIPKGEVEAGEELLHAAFREFAEEVGQPIHGETVPLGSVTLSSKKVVHAWTIRAPADFDISRPGNSITFPLEWPPKSGKTAYFPEVDRAQYFDLFDARLKLTKSQLPFLDRWEELRLL